MIEANQESASADSQNDSKADPNGDRQGKRQRDTQCQCVYRAEDRVPWGKAFEDLAEVQRFVDHVVYSATWQALGGPRLVDVRDGRGRRSACAEERWHGATLKVPRWARSELIVLHELAHALTSPSCAAHGPEFAGFYLALTRQFLSEDIYQALRDSFGEERVSSVEPRRVEPAPVEKVLQRVAELMALSAGTDSAAESANAAAMAQRLLLRHNLTQSDVQHFETRDADPLTESKRDFDGGSRRIPFWKNMLLNAVSQGTLCEWMTNFYSEGHARTYSFIGRQSNVDVACHLYQVLERQVEELWQKEKRALQGRRLSVRGQRASFCEGVVSGVRKRLLEERKSFETQHSQGRAIVRRHGQEAEAHRRELYPNVVFTRTSHSYSSVTARDRGIAASKDVRIQHALRKDGRAQRLLE